MRLPRGPPYKACPSLPCLPATLRCALDRGGWWVSVPTANARLTQIASDVTRETLTPQLQLNRDGEPWLRREQRAARRYAGTFSPRRPVSVQARRGPMPFSATGATGQWSRTRTHTRYSRETTRQLRKLRQAGTLAGTSRIGTIRDSSHHPFNSGYRHKNGRPPDSSPWLAYENLPRQRHSVNTREVYLRLPIPMRGRLDFLSLSFAKCSAMTPIYTPVCVADMAQSLVKMAFPDN